MELPNRLEIEEQHKKPTSVRNIEEALKSAQVFTLEQGLRGCFNNPLGNNPLVDWQYRLIIILRYFLNETKKLIQNNQATSGIKLVFISYVQADDE